MEKLRGKVKYNQCLYALALFSAIELIINVSPISQLYGFEWDNVLGAQKEFLAPMTEQGFRLLSKFYLE